MLRRQAGQVGLSNAEQWLGRSDGGNGLENFLKTNFPGPLQTGTAWQLILDFRHAADSLLQLAKVIHATDEGQRQELVTSWCHTMKHEGGVAIVEVLESVSLPERPALQAQHEETVG